MEKIIKEKMMAEIIDLLNDNEITTDDDQSKVLGFCYSELRKQINSNNEVEEEVKDEEVKDEEVKDEEVKDETTE